MKSILEACKPRPDILKGTFNPEIFTASISEVMRFYRGESTQIHSIYTNAEQFFGEITYPTSGMKMVVSEVFARLAGDNSVPAIHRLETAFGGGKTHTLIACAHIGFRGQQLASITSNLLPVEFLPPPGEVTVVGIAGDEIPVHKTKGTKLVPYTLWGEVAYQVGGEELYREVEEEASSFAAPGKTFFDRVLGGRKVLLMLDELAQYAARFEASSIGGADQLAAFLMSLHSYARTHEGIAIIVTLASATDAFANQTEQLTKLLSKVLGKEIGKDEALGLGQKAVNGVASVVARDATPVVPVQAFEISRVLAKRLFISIDNSIARSIADEYVTMYEKNRSILPAEATHSDFREQIIEHYPFHPTFIDYLNTKLATSEDFQGTRGVLRLLTLTIRNLWKKKVQIPMIHACHLDFRDPRIVSELLGRTRSGDLLPIINADIGGADTSSLVGARSNAELAERANPHPEGWPMYEYTWKTIFLNSLVGRSQGLGSSIFGITEQDLLFHVAFPGLTPPQVGEALKEVREIRDNSPFYLRYSKDYGRYYASLEPSINIALAKIRRGLSLTEIDELLDATARKVVNTEIKTFYVVHDVTAPEHIPDKKGKPVLALISLRAEKINVEECITTASPNQARQEQNLVFILVPETVKVITEEQDLNSFVVDFSPTNEQARDKLRDLARTVLAIRKLKKAPQDYGINPRMLNEDEVKDRFTERENALVTAVTQNYKNLWYPSASGQIVRKEIKTAGIEGGAALIEQVRKKLLDDKELITADDISREGLINLRKLFFKLSDVVAIEQIRKNFRCRRDWPVLDSPNMFDQIIRAGVNSGMWCVFRMGSAENVKPDEFYSRETGGIPFDFDATKDYSLITPEGARKRGWSQTRIPDTRNIQKWIKEAVYEKEMATVDEIKDYVIQDHDDISPPAVNEAIVDLVQKDEVMAIRRKNQKEEEPELITGGSALVYDPEADDLIVTPAKAAEQGWLAESSKKITLSGHQNVETLHSILRRIGSFYNKGGKTTVDLMDFIELKLPKGGSLRITIEKATPETLKDLGEFLEILSDITDIGSDTEIVLEINDPQDDCPFVRELQKGLDE